MADEAKPPDPAELERVRRIAVPTTVIGGVGAALFLGVWVNGKAGQGGLWTACTAGSLAALLGGIGLLNRKNWGRVILMALHATILALLGFSIYLLCMPRMIDDPLAEIIPIVMAFLFLFHSIRTLSVLLSAAPLMRSIGWFLVLSGVAMASEQQVAWSESRPDQRCPDGRYETRVPTTDACEGGARCELIDARTGRRLHRLENGEFSRPLNHGVLLFEWSARPPGGTHHFAYTLTETGFNPQPNGRPAVQAFADTDPRGLGRSAACTASSFSVMSASRFPAASSIVKVSPMESMCPSTR